MAREQTLACPSCGAPYKALIPDGTTQVKCTYCGATIFAPPHLEGTIQRCPNHPETQAVGLCNDCGESFCDHCLYIYKIEHGRLHLCCNCYAARKSKSLAGVVAVPFIGGIFLLALLSSTRSALVPPLPLFALLALLLIVLTAVSQAREKPASIHDTRAEH